VSFRQNLPIILAAVALAIAGVQAIHPIGFRVHPALMLVVAALFALRWVLRRQAVKRAALTQRIPKHPLGISEDAPGE